MYQKDRIFKKIDFFENRYDWPGMPLKPVLLDWYSEHVLADNSFESRLNAATRLYEWCFENKITKPDTDSLKEYYRYLSEKGLHETSIKTFSVQIKSFFKHLYDIELYPDITKKIKIKKGEYSERICLDKSEVRMLMKSVIPPKEKAMISLMVYCGLRCIEVSEMLWGDIDGETAFIRGKGKKEKNTQIYLPKTVISCLNDWKYHSKSGKENSDYVFKVECYPYAYGYTKYSASSISGMVSRMLKSIFPEKKGISAHCLRHTAITLAIESGMSIYRVTKFARHTTPSMTMTYVHDKQRFTDPAENRIENMINSDSNDTDKIVEDSIKRALMKLLKNSQSE